MRLTAFVKCFIFLKFICFKVHIQRTDQHLYSIYFLSTKGDCWICMELMTSSLEKTYKAVHKILEQKIPEDILGKIAFCVSLLP